MIIKGKDYIKSKTYLIAELGTLHLPDINNAKQAVKDCINAGADFVKFQCINPLTAWWASKIQYERYKSNRWSIEIWCDFIGQMNAEYEQPIFASIFDKDFITPELSNVMPCWKVALRMHDDQMMVSKMMWTGKPIFFSTNGFHYRHDKLSYFLREESNIIPLYATAYKQYYKVAGPTLEGFKHGRYHGISINFGGRDLLSLVHSLFRYCTFIEVHVKGEGAEGPDAVWSLSLKELENLRHEII